MKQMGCYQSSSIITFSRLHLENLSRTQVEIPQLETFLSEIPVDGQQAILNLPKRRLLKYYRYHQKAFYYGLQKKWSLVIHYEHRAIKGFQTLLPNNKDHYIFSQFYYILSASFLALRELDTAIEAIHIALAILLKYTPMDYEKISKHYYYLANIYKILKDWKATIQYSIIAIELVQNRNICDQEYIRTLTDELQLAKQQLVKDMSVNLSYFDIERKLSGKSLGFHRRIMAKTRTSYRTQNRLYLNSHNKIENFSNKPTNFQISDEVVKEVSTHLVTYVKLKWMEENSVILLPRQFIAEQFKNAQMKTSPLSAEVIEVALTMIVDRLNNGITDNDESYSALKQTSVSFSYTNYGFLYTKGVRVFEIREKECRSNGHVLHPNFLIESV